MTSEIRETITTKIGWLNEINKIHKIAKWDHVTCRDKKRDINRHFLVEMKMNNVIRT